MGHESKSGNKIYIHILYFILFNSISCSPKLKFDIPVKTLLIESDEIILYLGQV